MVVSYEVYAWFVSYFMHRLAHLDYDNYNHLTASAVLHVDKHQGNSLARLCVSLSWRQIGARSGRVMQSSMWCATVGMDTMKSMSPCLRSP